MALSSQYTVDGTAVKIASSNGTPIEVHVNAEADIWVGGSTVTTSNGFLINKGDEFHVTLADHAELWAIHDGLVATTVYALVSIL